MTRSEAHAVFRAVRVAVRDLDPLNLIRDGTPPDEYDDVSARAARVLIDGGTEEEAAEVMSEVFRTDWGVSLGRRKRRQVARRLRAADPRLAPLPVSAKPTTRLRGLFGLLLCAVAVSAVAVPGVGYVRALADEGVRLDGTSQHARLDPHRTYGIYVDDTNNSGYTASCSVVGSDGREVQMDDDPRGISFSYTETLNFVFRTGSSEATIDCSVPGERATARPVPNDRAMLLGLLLAGILGFAGVRMLSSRAVTQSSQMDSATVSRRANRTHVVLVAVTVAGFGNAVLAALGVMTSYAAVRSLQDEFDATRETALAIAWQTQLPFLVVGSALAIVGTIAVVKRQRKLENRTWRPVVLGLALAIPLTPAIGLMTAIVWTTFR